jgi:UDP-GlcNAc:undecaprenyl-phosphate GlcNAc-1-phosphate transferase
VIAQLNHPQVWMLILAWFLADLGVPLIIRLSHRVGALDRPHTYKTHQEPVALLGGVGIYLAFMITLISVLRFPDPGQYTDIFAIVVGRLPGADPGRPRRLPPHLGGGEARGPSRVTLLLSRFGVRINLTGIWAVDLALTLAWISGVSSAMNSMDNMDGAAGGTAAIASFWTFYVAWYTGAWGQPHVSFVAIAPDGRLPGLPPLQLEPAKIFLGDNGSLLLGFLLAALTVQCGWSRGDRIKAIIVPCAILCVPLYDITLSTILRIVRGVVKKPVEAIVYCGRDHLSHRLVALGLSKREAVLVLYLFGMISGTVAVIIVRPEVKPAVYIPIAVVSSCSSSSSGSFWTARRSIRTSSRSRRPRTSHEAVTHERSRPGPAPRRHRRRRHADTISRFLDEGEDLGSETGKGHLDLPRMFRGGLDAQFMSCWVEPKYVQRKEAAKRALRMIDAVKRWAAGYPDRLAIARSAAEVRRAVAEKKVCGILCIEGGHAIEEDLGLCGASSSSASAT